MIHYKPAYIIKGSLISIRLVSSMIPRKDKDVAGPSSLSATSGTPKSLHSAMNMSRLCWHTGDNGDPIVR